MNVPPGLDKVGRDEFGANIAFAEGFLVHAVIAEKVRSSGNSIQARDKNLARFTTRSVPVMPDVIRHPCFDSALAGYAQHKRPHVRPERSGAKSKGLSGAGDLDSCPCFHRGDVLSQE